MREELEKCAECLLSRGGIDNLTLYRAPGVSFAGGFWRELARGRVGYAFIYTRGVWELLFIGRVESRLEGGGYDCGRLVGGGNVLIGYWIELLALSSEPLDKF